MCAVTRVMKTDTPLSHSLGQLTVCTADVSQLALPSDSDLTEAVWRGRTKGAAHHFVRALTHLSIYLRIHPSLHRFPVSAPAS